MVLWLLGKCGAPKHGDGHREDLSAGVISDGFVNEGLLFAKLKGGISVYP